MQRRCRSIGVFFIGLVVAALATFATTVAAEISAERSDTVAGAAAADPGKKAAEPQPPLRISADSAEYFNTEGFVVFTGNVVAIQAETTISAERMEVSFEKQAVAAEKPATGIGAPASAQQISRIVAEKKVNFRQVDPESGKERFATGDKAVYAVDKRFVTMTGNPRLWEGKNVIVGEEMIFELAAKKVVVKGKVNLTVFPDDLKEQKKP